MKIWELVERIKNKIKQGKILANDKWFTIDKLWHILACIVITYFYGISVASKVGIAKELIDIGGTGFSYKDLVADVIGIAIGLILRFIIPLNVV